MKIVENCRYTGLAKNSAGSERVVEALTKAFIELGHEVVMHVNLDSTNMPAPIVDKIPSNFDIVHVHGGTPEEYNKIYPSWKLPFVSTIHGGCQDPPKSFWHNDSRMICVSKFVSDLSENPAFVHSCVDPADFAYKEKKENYFLWIGGTDWGESKGLATTIQLAQKLKFNLKIAGTGKNQEIINYVKSMCNSKIEYLGPVNGLEKANVIANAKGVFILSRISDACPLVVAESSISGTPIICFNHSSFPEIVVHNKTGFLCTSELDVTRAIVNIGKINPQDCRDFAMQNFHYHVAAQKYLMYFENMIKYGKCIP